MMYNPSSLASVLGYLQRSLLAYFPLVGWSAGEIVGLGCYHHYQRFIDRVLMDQGNANQRNQWGCQVSIIAIDAALTAINMIQTRTAIDA